MLSTSRKVLLTSSFVQCSADVVVAVDFHPMEANCFVTCGKGHLIFWFIESGNITRKSGIFESRDKAKYVLVAIKTSSTLHEKRECHFELN